MNASFEVQPVAAPVAAAHPHVERVALPVAPHRDFVRYLETKRDKMGHLVGV